MIQLATSGGRRQNRCVHIFIAVPSTGLVHAWFAQSLAAMVFRTAIEAPKTFGQTPKITTHINIGKLPMVRNLLLKEAIEEGPTHMLWLDSDHVFPDWTLLRLLMADRDVVGINQPTRSRPHVTTARHMDGSPVFGTEQDARNGLIERVQSIGFAIVLMRMSIMPKLEAQAAKEGRGSIFPMFNFSLSEDPAYTGGEDAFFCSRLGEAGIEINVDHQLSRATVHMADLPVRLTDATA